MISSSQTAISAIIPCRDHAIELGRTLEALARQTVKPSEVIVVDDGSVDDPETVVKSFSDRLPIQFLKLRHNHGAPYARNEGARLTSSPYLIFLDADAELVPDALESFLNALQEYPDAGFAYSNFFWGKRRFLGQAFDLDALRTRNYINTTSLVRKSVFPGFDESLKKFQDWDLWLTIAERGSKGVWINRELIRIEPQRKGKGISNWLPSFMHRIPWHLLGFQPKEIAQYRKWEAIVKQKHGI